MPVFAFAAQFDGVELGEVARGADQQLQHVFARLRRIPNKVACYQFRKGCALQSARDHLDAVRTALRSFGQRWFS